MANPNYSDYSQLPRDQNGDVNAEPHAGGEFFSSILWDLRNSIGANTTDFLVYDALYRVTGDPDFLDFRDAMIAADNAVYGGANYENIQNTFAEWGVGEPLELTVSISGPIALDTGELGSW